jgi:hypothetical protein
VIPSIVTRDTVVKPVPEICMLDGLPETLTVVGVTVVITGCTLRRVNGNPVDVFDPT